MLERLPKSLVPVHNARGPLAVSLDPRVADALLLVARVLMGYIFATSGWGKLLGIAAFAANLERQGVPASYAFAVLGACVEFFGGIALIFGVATRYVALLLIAFTIVATGISHRFWEFAEPARRGQLINFEKNLAMVGGFLALLVAGPGRLSLDRLIGRSS